VVDAAVVFTVSTVDPVAPALTVTLAGLRLHVGKLCAPVGELTSVQLIFIVPEQLLPVLRVTFVFVLPPGETPDGVAAEITTCTMVILADPLDPA
jgi:hypothetical protein